MKKLFYVFLILIVFGFPVFAIPELKINDTDLKCFQNGFNSNGYDECRLKIKLSVDDYEYSEKYKNLQFNVKCFATFDYRLNGSSALYSHQQKEENIERFYGTNNYGYLDIITSFYTLEAVTSVSISELTCKVVDIY